MCNVSIVFNAYNVYGTLHALYIYIYTCIANIVSFTNQCHNKAYETKLGQAAAAEEGAAELLEQRLLQERRDESVHSSQQKIMVEILGT